MFLNAILQDVILDVYLIFKNKLDTWFIYWKIGFEFHWTYEVKVINDMFKSNWHLRPSFWHNSLKCPVELLLFAIFRIIIDWYPQHMHGHDKTTAKSHYAIIQNHIFNKPLKPVKQTRIVNHGALLFSIIFKWCTQH